MSSIDPDDEIEEEMPKMKTINKPKNLKKRRRDVPDEEEENDESKKVKTELDADAEEYVQLMRLSVSFVTYKARFSAGALRPSLFFQFQPFHLSSFPEISFNACITRVSNPLAPH